MPLDEPARLLELANRIRAMRDRQLAEPAAPHRPDGSAAAAPRSRAEKLVARVSGHLGEDAGTSAPAPPFSPPAKKSPGAAERMALRVAGHLSPEAAAAPAPVTEPAPATEPTPATSSVTLLADLLRRSPPPTAT